MNTLRTALICILFVCSSIKAANRAPKRPKYYRRGLIVGMGGCFAKYTTNWNLADNISAPPVELEDKPSHIHTKYEFLFFLEERSLFQFLKIHLDIRVELRAGLLGGVDQDYLNDSLPSAISSGGRSLVGGAHFKFVKTLRLKPKVTFAPFIGIGFSLANLKADGKDLDRKYDDGVYPDRSYGIGWTEFGVFPPLSLGLNLVFQYISITPEVRYIHTGLFFTDLKGSPALKQGSIQSLAMLLTFGFRRYTGR